MKTKKPRKQERVIYGLFDPDTDELRYIGLSYYGLSSRLSSHIIKAKNGESTPKAAWIVSLLVENKKPVGKVLYHAQETEDLREKEKYFIEEYKNKGANLTNLTKGGQGTLGYVHSDETKNELTLLAKNRYENDPNHPWHKSHIPVEHKIINGEECKLCSQCKTYFSLKAFHKATEYDGLFHMCRACEHVRTMKRRFNKEVEWDASFNTQPELNKCKQIKAVPVNGGPELKFNSIKEAQDAGFHQANILRAKKNNKAYKGYNWFDN